ncbi:hypothetical protein [Bacillus wiedmannii]|uniref:hypothetical protein n=1 Tax=Bacillus wiedmannii TaxID=1890302 RepID=UPI000BF241D3|nr:hypothetical protein [Bacillus wiedmannii]MBG9829697.1 hypothetical protein [Bacillus wiedmannii]PEO36757.1 hypothetical protein CN555_21385 [Bacillus wiedmannii]UOB95762.1 hypothetical protein BTI679_31050 [Bacillus wiedmannii]
MKIEIAVPQEKVYTAQRGDILVTDDETYILSQENGDTRYGVIRPDRESMFQVIEGANSISDVVEHIKDEWGEIVLEVIPANKVKLVRV